MATWMPWERLPLGVRAVPPLVFLLSAAVLRDSAGGVASGVGVLALLPVFWVALYGRKRELAIVVVGVAVYYLVPSLLIGGIAYPASGYRTTVLFVAVSAIVGLTVQRLVQDGRSSALEIAHHSRDLQRVAEISRMIATSTDARAEVCEAARELGDASFALLLEPDGDGGLISTAMAGLDIPPIASPPVQERPTSRTAFGTRRSIFIARAENDRSINQALWATLGRPRSMLLEPVLRGEAAVGVLVLGWAEPVSGERQGRIISLVAGEAAIAIERADLVEQLTGLATTDVLTGVLNRRGWDDQLGRVLADPARDTFCVAMLDLDNFKAFNDSHGHQRGDRLLRAATAAWRDALRPGDILARHGGEEFAVLLPHCRTADATAVIERLRAVTPGEETCSAGIAESQRRESPLALMQRADEALYAAKSAGRDRSVAV
jgi:diguanylate cyclase (GGDEF)-like protein